MFKIVPWLFHFIISVPKQAATIGGVIQGSIGFTWHEQDVYVQARDFDRAVESLRQFYGPAVSIVKMERLEGVVIPERPDAELVQPKESIQDVLDRWEGRTNQDRWHYRGGRDKDFSSGRNGV